MSANARKHNKAVQGKYLQKAGQRSKSDVDDTKKPTNQSLNEETLLLADSTGELKDQRDEQGRLLAMTHDLPVPDPTTSCLQYDLSLSGSASKTCTDATSYQNRELDGKVCRTKEDELRSDASVEAVGASEKLKHQIESLLRDSEFIDLYKPKLDFDEFELKYTSENVAEPTPDMSATDPDNVTKSNNVIEPCNGVSHRVCQSQDSEKLSDVKRLSHLAKAEFYLADENLGEFLNLLQHLNGICCKSKFQQRLGLNMVHEPNKNPQIGQDGHTIHSEKCDTSSLLTKVDHLEDSIQETKEEQIRKLLMSISEVLEKNQFSSAGELTKFLETVELMRVEIDKWCHIHSKTKTASSRDNEDQTALDSARDDATSVNDALAVLRTRLCEILTQLSNSLVLWQDFIETRVELEHELTMEQYFLNSIQTNISCNELLRTRLEAEHDLKLVEDNLKDYTEKLTSMRMCNRHLVPVLDDSTISSNRRQTGKLAGELEDIKDSCSSLRRTLNAAPGKALSSTEMTSERRKAFHSSHAQTERSVEDFDNLDLARLVLKMILLLFLIVLLLLFVSYFEPHLYHPLNRFRLPVLIHMRHVGTYPPM